jgi:hypothetical protein
MVAEKQSGLTKNNCTVIIFCIEHGGFECLRNIGGRTIYKTPPREIERAKRELEDFRETLRRQQENVGSRKGNENGSEG